MKPGLRFRKSRIEKSLTVDGLLISVFCRSVDKQEEAITELANERMKLFVRFITICYFDVYFPKADRILLSVCMFFVMWKLL